MSAVTMIIILFMSVIIALVVGYFIGSMTGRGNARAAVEEKRKHDELKEDVREHFRQTSALMSRMAEDYRQMQEHMSVGAEKLAGLTPERQVETRLGQAQQTQQHLTQQGEDVTAQASNDARTAQPSNGESSRQSQASAGATQDSHLGDQASTGQTAASQDADKPGATQSGTEKKSEDSVAVSNSDSATGQARSGGAEQARGKPGQPARAKHVPIGSARKK